MDMDMDIDTGMDMDVCMHMGMGMGMDINVATHAPHVALDGQSERHQWVFGAAAFNVMGACT